MSISLTIGNLDPLSVSGLKDLVGEARATNLKLGPEFSAFLGQPLAALPPHFNSTGVQFTGGAPAWTRPSGTAVPFTFTLSAGVCGKISVITSGDLLRYTDGFSQTVAPGLSTLDANSNAVKTIPVGAGEAFVVLELEFQLSGRVTASYQPGVYGVSTTDTAATALSVAFYKSCPPSMPLQDAVKQAFAGFVLPLHEKTLEHLSAGDYLHYNFSANLQLGVGANIGYDKVFYAGTTTQSVPGTASAVTLTGAIAPQVQAGAKFCFAYDYSGAFEILLWCDAARKASLHLYRARVQNTTAGANFGVTLSPGSAGSLGATTAQVKNLMTGSLPANVQATFRDKVMPAAEDELAKYVGELNGKVTSWLTRTNVQVASLDLAIQHTGSRFLLTDYTLDLNNPNYAGAWKSMIEGRYLDALQMPDTGVTLATGSGTEALFKTAAAIKLNLFGALHAAWTTDTFSNSSLVYAGNNVFHLLTVAGKDVLAVRDATQKEMTMYFAAEADLSTAGSRIPPPQLHCVLQADSKPDFGRELGRLMELLSTGPAVQALAASVAATAQQPKSTVTLHLVFEPGQDAYGGLDASNLQHGKPDDENKDRKNYEAFAEACRQVFKDGPASLQWDGQRLTYGLWRDAWIASNDQWPAPEGSVPNRREHAGCGPGVQAQLDGALSGLSGSSGQAQLIFYALEAAAQFMNLCDDLRALAAQTAAYTPGTWPSFVAELAGIVKNDLDTDFMPATMLALAMLCGGTPTAVSGPIAALPLGTSIGVTMTYGTPS